MLPARSHFHTCESIGLYNVPESNLALAEYFRVLWGRQFQYGVKPPMQSNSLLKMLN